jgi:hypothetical protein
MAFSRPCSSLPADFPSSFSGEREISLAGKLGNCASVPDVTKKILREQLGRIELLSAGRIVEDYKGYELDKVEIEMAIEYEFQVEIKDCSINWHRVSDLIEHVEALCASKK